MHGGVIFLSELYETPRDGGIYSYGMPRIYVYRLSDGEDGGFDKFAPNFHNVVTMFINRYE